MTEYWIVDPELETIKVHRLEGSRYHRRELSFEEGGILTTSLLAGLAMPLARIVELP